ncbi:MAG: tetratricopeptide repeat protein [Candidatus Aminicenantes bacterium]|nr:tetratricopeptide repeat protein [Candidatus Aminicenantes bacterium]
MRQKIEKIAARSKATCFSHRKFIGVLVSSGIIIVFLIFTSQAFAQKSPKDIEATDFVLDVAALYLNVGEIDKALDYLKNLGETFPSDYDIRLYSGMALCKKQDYDSAFEVFREIEKALEWWRRVAMRGRLYFGFSSKNKGLLYFGRGITLLMVKTDFKAAKKRFIQALKEGYDETNVRYLLIYSHIKLKDYKEANEELNNLLEKKEMNEKDAFIKGYVNYMQGLEDKAVSLFTKAQEINPDLIEAKKNLACICYNNFKWEKAIELWKSVIDKIPEDFESNLNLGRASFHLGRLEEARQQFEMLKISVPVQKYSPKKIPLVFIPWEDWTHFNIEYQVNYEALLKQRNLERLKKTEERIRRHAAIFLNEKSFFLLRKEGNVEETIKILNFAKEIDETSFFVNYNLGQLYLNSGNMEKAKECALQSIKYKKNFLEAHDLLGNVYFKEGMYENALKEFNKVIEISESDEQGHYNLGCAYWALKAWEKAEEEWIKAIECDAGPVRNEKEKKYTRDGLGFSLIVRKRPVAYRAHISLGSLYKGERRLENAIREYEKAIKREPNNPEAYFELGSIYFDRNSWEKAKFYLERHIDLGGQNQEKARILLNSIRNKY